MFLVVNNQNLTELVEGLRKKFPKLEISEDLKVEIEAKNLFSFVKELKEDEEYGLNYLTNLTSADYEDRFEMVYNILSMEKGFDLMIKVKLDKNNPTISSLAPLWKGAIWQEREVYDLMGINFTGYDNHPTRILLLDTFVGHPLRKDFQYVGGR